MGTREKYEYVSTKREREKMDTTKKTNIISRFFTFLFYGKKTGQPMRYLFVGGTCSVIDIALLYVFVEFFHIWYLYASILSFTISCVVAFFGQKYFTFRNESRKHVTQFALFFTMAGTGLLINSGCIFVFVSLLGLWYILASVITKFIVLIWNFCASKYITFRIIR